jgi:hypothetical protein
VPATGISPIGSTNSTIKERGNRNCPIGSGEVESGHGYIIQDRLKLSGAWWNIGNAAKMLALRVSRANEDWESYWEKLYLHAA